MSAFDEGNVDAYSIDIGEGARGPSLGFMDAFNASLDVQRKVHSQLGLEKAFRDVEQAQIKKMRDAGLEPHAPLDAQGAYTGPTLADPASGNTSGRYDDPYQRVARAIYDGDEQGAHDDVMQARDDQIKRVQKEHPELGLQTYGEMFKQIRDQAQEAVRLNSLPTTTMGTAGSVLGGMVGAVDPTRNPMNFGTMFLGGGSTVLGRAAVQGGIQAGVEGADILTNDNERLLTGHEATAGENLGRIVMAAGGGIGGQLLGEGVGMAVRKGVTGKWFHDLPVDALPTREAPKIETPDLMPGERMAAGRPLLDYPDFQTFAQAHGINTEFERALGGTREATARKTADLDYVAREIDRWDGPPAHDVAARTDTALPPDVEPGARYDNAYQKYVDRMDTPDTIARRLDPELFDKYDKLAARHDELRQAIDRGRELGDLRPNADRPDIKAQFEKQRAETEASTREAMMHVDEQMRDLAPLVSRAYGAAEKEWRHVPVDFDTLNFLKKIEQGTGWNYRGEGKPSLSQEPLKARAQAAAIPTQTVADVVPLSRLTSEQNAKLRSGANDAADRVAIASKDAGDALGEKIEHFVKQARETVDVEKVKSDREMLQKKLDDMKADPALAKSPDRIARVQAELDALDYVTMPDGAKLHLDKDMLPGPDGNEMSVRDFLREMDKDQHALDAVTTCSRPS